MAPDGPLGVTQANIEAQVRTLLEDATDGTHLGPLDEAFISVAVHACATAMDVDGTREALERAQRLGATPEQLHEAIELVSGMGVHAFFEGSRTLDRLVLGDGGAHEPLDEHRRRLWDTYVGDGRYWRTMEEEVPGFLAALLRRSPAAFEAFFQFCAVPWKSGYISNVTKELMSAAVDATPSHRYLPGMRLHIRNALKLGAGRFAIERAIAIGAAGPAPHGVQ